MNRSSSSGISLTNQDARIVLSMVARGDRRHDIAAWFGVNQGRIAEVEDGEYGELIMAPADQLPPKGPPGPKGRRLKAFVMKAITSLEGGDQASALAHLRKGIEKYNSHES